MPDAVEQLMEQVRDILEKTYPDNEDKDFQATMQPIMAVMSKNNAIAQMLGVPSNPMDQQRLQMMVQQQQQAKQMNFQKRRLELEAYMKSQELNLMAKRTEAEVTAQEAITARQTKLLEHETAKLEFSKEQWKHQKTGWAAEEKGNEVKVEEATLALKILEHQIKDLPNRWQRLTEDFDREERQKEAEIVTETARGKKAEVDATLAKNVLARDIALQKQLDGLTPIKQRSFLAALDAANAQGKDLTISQHFDPTMMTESDALDVILGAHAQAGTTRTVDPTDPNSTIMSTNPTTFGELINLMGPSIPEELRERALSQIPQAIQQEIQNRSQPVPEAAAPQQGALGAFWDFTSRINPLLQPGKVKDAWQSMMSPGP